MEDFGELDFVIPAYTPETMPLDRLLQYLQEIAEVVGVPHDMHLVRIEQSSTKPVFKMPLPMANEARERAARVQRGEGTMRQRRAYHRIRQMVRRDGGKPAILRDRSGIILDFPPEVEVGPITGVRQATTFDGVLLRVGGAGDYTPILMQDLGGDVHAGFSASRGLAKQMAPLIFDPIRVNGIGSWDRNQAGEWKLVKMLIQSYDPLDNESLPDVLNRLRAAPVVWPENADAIMRAERE
ncbi:MAG TPA: hypothetical protein VMB73_17520 [Acetobacteraceae bacterium]|nr:hypothetical protein [Acetobacteraceae bacterium]